MSDNTWDGEGLPPVGTVCEYRLESYSPWFECEVVSHDRMVIHCPHLESDEDNGLQVVKNHASVEFRPILTLEQRAVEAMAQVIRDEICVQTVAGASARSVVDAIRAGRIPGVKLDQ